MRLIDADALKETIKNQHWKSDTQMELTLKWIDMLINEAPTIESPRDWTPCTEGLPEKETDNVLVCFLDKFGFMEVSIGWYWIPNEKWYTDAKSSPVDVIAWQPLPAPYRADDTTGKVKEDEFMREAMYDQLHSNGN